MKAHIHLLRAHYLLLVAIVATLESLRAPLHLQEHRSVPLALYLLFVKTSKFSGKPQQIFLNALAEPQISP